MGSLFKAPSPPPAPVYQPPVEPPSYKEAEAKLETDTETKTREAQAAEELSLIERKRKGRRSTILTGTGLNEEAPTEKKTLLGG